MDREIKFRAWDKVLKSMVEINAIYWNADYELIRIDFENKYGEASSAIPNDFKLMQYTGLRDKNGKEIYEGDIVKVDNRSIGYIAYSSDGFVFTDGHGTWTLFKRDSYGNPTDSLKKQHKKILDVIVIGNKFQNRKLLNT